MTQKITAILALMIWISLVSPADARKVTGPDRETIADHMLPVAASLQSTMKWSKRDAVYVMGYVGIEAKALPYMARYDETGNLYLVLDNVPSGQNYRLLFAPGAPHTKHRKKTTLKNPPPGAGSVQRAWNLCTNVKQTPLGKQRVQYMIPQFLSYSRKFGDRALDFQVMGVTDDTRK